MKLSTKWILLVGCELTIACFASSAIQFQHPRYDSTGTTPYRIVCAQFTSSGNLDLAIANYPANTVTVLLGKGNGEFQSEKSFSVSSPVGLAAGDMDGDGNSDLVVTESGGTGQGFLSVFLSNGDGTFRKTAHYQSAIEVGTVTVADFNGDGCADVAQIFVKG
jgi:FG-GAP-like repeat